MQDWAFWKQAFVFIFLFLYRVFTHVILYMLAEAVTDSSGICSAISGHTTYIYIFISLSLYLYISLSLFIYFSISLYLYISTSFYL